MNEENFILISMMLANLKMNYQILSRLLPNKTILHEWEGYIDGIDEIILELKEKYNDN